MKNILKAIAVTAAMVGMGGGVAFADSCTITNTGNGSVNTCIDTTNNNTIFFCNNNVNFNSTNFQTGQSGTASVSGNGSGGTAASGNVSNSTFSSIDAQLGCSTPAQAPATPVTTPSTPQVLADQVSVKPVGGAGAGAGAGVASNKVAATTGIVASAALVGLGLAIRKGAIARN